MEPQIISQGTSLSCTFHRRSRSWIYKEVEHKDVMVDRRNDVSKEEHGEFPNQKDAGVTEEHRQEKKSKERLHQIALKR